MRNESFYQEFTLMQKENRPNHSSWKIAQIVIIYLVVMTINEYLLILHIIHKHHH